MRTFLLYSAISLAAVSGVATASDGRREINQACVSSGCFPGDGPGFPVEISSAGSFVLTGNLTVSDVSTSAIQIGATNVGLDLNGFAVTGPVSCTGEPVTSCSHSGAESGITASPGEGQIHGGSVRGFSGNGITAGRDSRIFDMVVSHNGNTGIGLSPGASVRNCTVTFNGGNGIQANSGGGFAEVAGSTVRGNALDGVIASGGLIRDSRFQNNGQQGIDGSAAAGGNAVNGNAGVPQVGASIDVIACNQIGSAAICPP